MNTDSMLIVGGFVTQATNDSRQIQPMLEVLTGWQEQVGQVSQLLADTGFSVPPMSQHAKQRGMKFEADERTEYSLTGAIKGPQDASRCISRHDPTRMAT